MPFIEQINVLTLSKNIKSDAKGVKLMLTVTS